MSQLPLKFSFHFSGKVWQTALDASAGLLAVEVRDQATFRLDFELLNLQNGQREHLYSPGMADWWTTLLRLEGSHLLLEKFNDPNDPTDKELIVYDVSIRRVSQLLPFFQFVAIKDGVLIGHHSRETGKPMSRQIGQRTKMERNPSRALFPTYLPPGSEGFQLLTDYLGTPLANLGVEYLEMDDCMIASYYQQSGTKFDRMLLVVKGDSEICRLIQDQTMEGFAPGSFFAYDRLLIFTQNSHQINGMEL